MAVTQRVPTARIFVLRVAIVLAAAGIVQGCAGNTTTPTEPPPASVPSTVEAPAPEPSTAEAPASPVDLQSERLSAAHILVGFAGTEVASRGSNRTRDEAKARAELIREKAISGLDFEKLAEEYSDSPSAARGGHLGVFARNTMVPSFEQAVRETPVGEVGQVVETPFGLHVFKRLPVIEAHLWHVQIGHQDAPMGQHERTQAEALERAKLVVDALQRGDTAADVARQYSDDPTAQINGGDLGIVAPGQMVPAFDKAAFSLEIGDTSPPFETAYGVHVVRRLPVKNTP